MNASKTNLKPSTKRAVENYSRSGCVRAYLLNTKSGEGAASIANSYDIPNVRTTRQADAAINAGRDLIRSGHVVA
jgi:hypothetical protein